MSTTNVNTDAASKDIEASSTLRRFHTVELPTAAKLKLDKYFLCFGFELYPDTSLKDFHVTLLYFGELRGLQKEVVKMIVDKGMRSYNNFYYGRPTIDFNTPDMFGEMKDLPVLKPDPEYITNVAICTFFNRMEELRNRMSAWQGGDVKYDFNPHLTTHLPRFRGTIDRLVLCKNKYEVVHTWPIFANNPKRHV